MDPDYVKKCAAENKSEGKSGSFFFISEDGVKLYEFYSTTFSKYD